MPESRRDLRHRVRARLSWAGFGGLRDGLWIAPGTVDVAAVLGVPTSPTPRSWPTPSPPGRCPGPTSTGWCTAPGTSRPCARRTTGSSRRGAARRGSSGSLAQLTLLGADWLRLLRTDPGCPPHNWAPDWPAATSSAVYRRVFDGLEPAARAALERSLRAAAAEGARIRGPLRRPVLRPRSRSGAACRAGGPVPHPPAGRTGSRRRRRQPSRRPRAPGGPRGVAITRRVRRSASGACRSTRPGGGQFVDQAAPPGTGPARAPWPARADSRPSAASQASTRTEYCRTRSPCVGQRGVRRPGRPARWRGRAGSRGRRSERLTRLHILHR